MFFMIIFGLSWFSYIKSIPIIKEVKEHYRIERIDVDYSDWTSEELKMFAPELKPPYIEVSYAIQAGSETEYEYDTEKEAEAALEQIFLQIERGVWYDLFNIGSTSSFERFLWHIIPILGMIIYWYFKIRPHEKSNGE